VVSDATVLTELELPDGRKLIFKYNEFGEVAEAIMPTGGRVEYDYADTSLNAITGTGLPVGNSLDDEVNAMPGGGNVKQIDRAVVPQRFRQPRGDMEL
jgi:YD repeat-containing protein